MLCENTRGVPAVSETAHREIKQHPEIATPPHWPHLENVTTGLYSDTGQSLAQIVLEFRKHVSWSEWPPQGLFPATHAAPGTWLKKPVLETLQSLAYIPTEIEGNLLNWALHNAPISHNTWSFCDFKMSKSNFDRTQQRNAWFH